MIQLSLLYIIIQKSIPRDERHHYTQGKVYITISQVQLKCMNNTLFETQQ